MNKTIKDLIPEYMPDILLDTSAIIDGRVADVAEAGFLPGRLLVPRFVLSELQNIADSSDPLRRERGQRGLETLQKLRGMASVSLEVVADDVSGERDVDSKLVALAQAHNIWLMTTDHNLNRVAEIQFVKVLNVNKLTISIRPSAYPGDELLVKVVGNGREQGQGVGYMTDGTMIVVDGGAGAIGRQVLTKVTRILQTGSGKMVFCSLNKSHAIV